VQMSQTLAVQHLKGFASAETHWLCRPVQLLSLHDLRPIRFIA
jgi:hypothetical protein